MFKKILIANRGEIACRVINTAHRLGISTVAVYSDVDESARHVSLADEAYRIGGSTAGESYLRMQKIIQIAQKADVQAIHPGYGFLSENASFAAACSRAGIIFVGPSPKAIRTMASKAKASSLMKITGVSLLPGYRGVDQSFSAFRKAAAEIGYPIIIKPALGGGGKGMVNVESANELREALKSALRISLGAFNSSRLVIEKLLPSCRHIEVQVFGDVHGNIVHLFERDCSIQRRYQKIIEETPAPGMTTALRRYVGESATQAARAIGYIGAGTVEFLADMSCGLHRDRIYFLEMNTRLQVEHGITEMITGQDLVEWQFKVANGESLPLRQSELRINGHSLEARIYAESPNQSFSPATGALQHVRWPGVDKSVRIDTGFEEGDEISSYYDPLVSKLIVHGRNRTDSLVRIKRALNETRIAGISTNIPFLLRLIDHPDFRQANLTTGFIARHSPSLLLSTRTVPDQFLVLAALDELLRRKDSNMLMNDPYSPWAQANTWRMNSGSRDVIHLSDGFRNIALTVRLDAAGEYLFETPNGSVRARATRDPPVGLNANLDGVQVNAIVWRVGQEISVSSGTQSHTLTLMDRNSHEGEYIDIKGTLMAPMPGRIVSVPARVGSKVRKGAPLIIIEAMKMEHTICAPDDGTITGVNFSEGDQVSEGVQLIEFREDRKV